MAMRGSLIGAVVAAIILLHEASAKQCALRPDPTDGNFADATSIIIHSQSDLDTQLENCTSIDGGLAIASDYTGSFSLPGIDTFTGEGIWQMSPPSTPGLTSISLPDVINLANMNLEDLPALTSISLPKVEAMESLTLVGNSSVTIDCGSLIVINTLMIEASGPTLNFTSLQQVDERLSIQAVPESMAYAPSSDLEFPSLSNATSISLVGHISSIYMPNLEIALSATSGVYTSNGLDIESYGDPLTVSLPSLYQASGILLNGNFASLSFPSLLTLDGVFSLYSNLPFSVNFTTLQSVVAISLEGKISSFSMPSIKDIASWVEVTSSVKIDCSIAKAQWAKTNSSSIVGVSSSTEAHHFSCESTAKKSLSTGAKVGMAFGIIVVLGVILFTVAWATQNRWRRKATLMAPKDHEHELGAISKTTSHITTSERPPPYAASVHSDIGPLAEPKSAF